MNERHQCQGRTQVQHEIKLWCGIHAWKVRGVDIKYGVLWGLTNMIGKSTVCLFVVV